MKYIILKAPIKETLEEKVNQKIKTGWQPLGGLQIAMTKSPTHCGELVYCFAQSMTRSGKE